MYQFQKINEDEFKLIGNGKEFIFKRTVDIAKELQSADMLATIKVAEILAERGETYDNTKLRIERTEGSNTVIDESNLRALEREAKKQANLEIFNKIYMKLFNKYPIELIKEIGIDIEDLDEIEKFSAALTKILNTGTIEDTPRGEIKEGNREQ